MLAYLRLEPTRAILLTQNPLGLGFKGGATSAQRDLGLSVKGPFFTWWEAGVGDSDHDHVLIPANPGTSQGTQRPGRKPGHREPEPCAPDSCSPRCHGCSNIREGGGRCPRHGV